MRSNRVTVSMRTRAESSRGLCAATVLPHVFRLLLAFTNARLYAAAASWFRRNSRNRLFPMPS